MKTELAPLGDVEAALRRICIGLPGVVRHRFENSLEHLDRARRIFEIDKEMASFRAITGEEEAATALIKSVQLRDYPGSSALNGRDHVHKSAVKWCVLAIAAEMQPVLQEFRLVFHWEKRRIDIKIPISNFGVQGGEEYAIQPVEPLDQLHTKTGVDENQLFDGTLRNLALGQGHENIRRMVSDGANARNKLLYASDAVRPESRATLAALESRRSKALTMLVLSIMVLQSRKHLNLARQATQAIVKVISRLPPDTGSATA